MTSELKYLAFLFMRFVVAFVLFSTSSVEQIKLDKNLFQPIETIEFNERQRAREREKEKARHENDGRMNVKYRCCRKDHPSDVK